jgi:hypothetical protein
MRLHQLGHDFVFLDQPLLKLGDLLVFGITGPLGRASGRPFERLFRLIEHLPDPEMDQSRLDVEFIGQAGNGPGRPSAAEPRRPSVRA